MKNIKPIILSIIFAVFALASCDIVEPPYIQGGGGNGGSDTTIVGEVMSKVLLEDFTGVKCVNCPAATELALQLHEVYGDRLVIMGIHAGFMATPIGPNSDFRTPEGTAWWNFFGFDANPIGTVNRKSSSNGYGINSGEWGDAISQALEQEPQALLEMQCSYDQTSRVINVDVNTKVLVDQLDNLSLTVCVVEDSVVGRQLLPSGMVEDYVHRHVFRGTMNGEWGESIGNAPFASGTEVKKSYQYTLPEAYNADNCSVIAYVYRDTDKGVIQVEETHLK